LRRWIGLGSDLCPPSEFENTEYHTDFFRPRDVFYQCGAIIEQNNGGLAVLTALRSKSHADFDATHVRFLNKIHPHVERALRLHAQMLQLKDTASAATRAVDSFDVGLAGLDGDGTVCFANGLAESLFRSGEVLRLQNGKIVAHDPRETAAFQLKHHIWT
jgi:PAS domain-containing protein